MLKILHVDDEADIREVAGMALDLDPEIELTSAASGAEALGLLRAGLRPDLLLLDVMMPGLDGPGTLAAAREIDGVATTPAIFMTARVQAHEQGKFLEHGAIGVIVKPFDPMTLAQSVRDHLASGR